MKVEDDVSPELPLLVCSEGDITTTVLAKLVVRIRKCFKDIASHYAEVKCFDILLLVVSIPSGSGGRERPGLCPSFPHSPTALFL